VCFCQFVKVKGVKRKLGDSFGNDPGSKPALPGTGFWEQKTWIFDCYCGQVRDGGSYSVCRTKSIGVRT
jgi:hypothetical protein